MAAPSPLALLLAAALVASRLPPCALAQSFGGAGGASAATVSALQTQRGSLGGGTYLSIWGSGFARGGRDGQTVVYVGNDVCEQTQATDYDSGDARLVCVTPASSVERSVDVRVAIVALDGSNSYVACPSTAACKFAYSLETTPLLQFSSRGGAAGTIFKAFGALRGATSDAYFIRVNPNGAGGAGGALSDAGEEVQTQPAGALSGDWGSTQQVRCQLGGDTEAGARLAVNLEVRDSSVGGKGFGRPLQAVTFPSAGVASSSLVPDPSFTGAAGASADGAISLTVHARVTALSLNASGLGGAPALVISGAGFSTRGDNSVELDGVPCAVDAALSTGSRLVCRPGAAPNATRDLAAMRGAFAPGGAGMLHALYLLSGSVAGSYYDTPTFLGAASDTFPAALAPSVVGTNVDMVNGYFGYYGGANGAENYLEVLLGLFEPPATANYSFYVRGDDRVALWLSSDDSAANQALVASTTYYNDDWFAGGAVGGSPSANPFVSRPLLLTAGRRYLMRAKHHEGGGMDWFDVSMRVHATGNAEATAALAAPAVPPFAPLPSVQRVTVLAVPVREVQTLSLTGAADGSFGLRAGGAPAPGSVVTNADGTTGVAFLAADASCAQVVAQVRGTGGCTSISCAKTGSAARGGAVQWAISFNCPVAAAGATFPDLSAFSVSLSSVNGSTFSLAASRTQTASAPLGGTFALTFDAGAGLGPQRTPPIAAAASALDLVNALKAAGAGPRVDAFLVSGGAPGDARTWRVTFHGATGAATLPLVGVALDDGSDLATPVALLGANASVAVAVLQAGAPGDAWFFPMPVTPFVRAALPMPGVVVRSNGLLAVCDHVANATDPTALNAPIQLLTPGAPSSTGGACGFNYSAALTPVVTGAASDWSGTAAITAGATLTVLGSGFLPLSAGAGLGLGGAALTAGQLNRVVLTRLPSPGDAPGATAASLGVSAPCAVTSASETQLVCTVGDAPAGLYSVGVAVALGRGFALVQPSYSDSVPTFTYAVSVAGFAPAAGSRAGGTLLNVSGTGFSPFPAAVPANSANASGLAPNVVTVGGQPCAVVAATASSIACRVPPTADGARTAAATGSAPATVVVNGATASGSFSYDAARTPLVTALSPATLSAATSNFVNITLDNVAPALVGGSAGAYSLSGSVAISFGGRACSPRGAPSAVLSLAPSSTFSAGGAFVARLQCVLLRAPQAGPAPMPQAPLVPTVELVDAANVSQGFAAADGRAGADASPFTLDAGFRVASVSPPLGSLLGGALLTVSGAGFTGRLSATSVTFFQASSFAALGAPPNPVACAVVSLAADGSSLTCRVSRPSYETIHDFRAGFDAGLIAGNVSVTVNGVAALCASASACEFGFARSATPAVSAVQAAAPGADGAAAAVTLTGEQLREPLLVWFGTVLAPPASVSVSADGTNATVGAPPVQTAGVVSVWVSSGALGNALVGAPTYAAAPVGAPVGARGDMVSFPTSSSPLLNLTCPLAVTGVAAWGSAGAGSAPLRGSVAGGHLLLISGRGFSRTLARNLVTFSFAGSASAAPQGVVLAANETLLLVRTPPCPSTAACPSGGGANASMLVVLLNAAMDGPAATASPPADAASYWFDDSSAAFSPTIQRSYPLAAARGQLLTIVGTGFGGAGDGTGDAEAGADLSSLTTAPAEGVDAAATAAASSSPPPAGSGLRVLVGNAPCIVTSWNATTIECELGDTPGGTHSVLVLVAGAGLARPKGVSAANAGAGTVAIALSLAGGLSASQGGVGGGLPLTISGSGFATPAQGGSNAVTVCGAPAAVLSATATSLTVATPALRTGPALDLFGTYEEAVIGSAAAGAAVPPPVVFGASGFGAAAAAGPAVDGQVASTFRSCVVGLDLGPSFSAVVTRLRFYPRFRNPGPFGGSVFDGLPAGLSPATAPASAWRALWTAPPASQLNEGWNYFDLLAAAVNTAANNMNGSAASLEAPGAAGGAPATRLRYLRWTAAAGSDCSGQEVQFVGFTLAANDGALCAVNVTVATPDTVYTPGTAPVSAAASIAPGAFAYSAAATPSVTAIAPSVGSALGGDSVTLTGTGFGNDGTTSVSVVLNGVPCAVTAASASSVTCTTGARGAAILPASVRLSVAGVGLALVNDSSTTFFSYVDRWSALTTWLNDEPPGPGDTVVVPVGQAILVDVSPPPLKLLLVQGRLSFDDAAPGPLALDAHYIFVLGGQFSVGSAAQPFRGNLTVTLHGDRLSAIEIPEVGAKCLAVMNSAFATSSSAVVSSAAAAAAALSATRDPGAAAAAQQIAAMTAALGDGFGLGSGLTTASAAMQMQMAADDAGMVMSAADAFSGMGATSGDMPGVRGAPNPAILQGSIDIHGAPRQRAWTKMSASAAAGATSISLAEPVDWAPGETIVVSATGGPDESETAVVASRPDERTVVLAAPLRFAHESSFFPGGAFGHSDADTRCAVGLLSRNVVIQGDEGSAAQLFGVHTGAFMGASFRVENAEFRRCGQGFLLGRYCSHVHLGSDRSDSYVRANSFHESFQRAVTVHATNYLRVQDNVAFNVRGHAYFVEDGVEQFNVIEGNLAVRTVQSYASLKSDTKPASFWMASPTNIWRHNVAAGCTHDGYWFEPPGNPNGPSYSPTYCPIGMPIGQFLNNTAYANGVHGLRIYPAYTPSSGPNGCPFASPPNGRFTPTLPQHFYNFTSFRNGAHGIFNKRTGDLHHVFPKLLENGAEDMLVMFLMPPVTLSWDPNVRDALMVGTRDPARAPRGAGKQALTAPQSEYYFVSGLTAVNYGAAGAIAGCAGCDNVGGEFEAQGAYTVRFERMRFVNSSVRTFWTPPVRNDIFWDLDGSFSGSGAPNSWIVGPKRFNAWPECPTDVAGTFAGGNVCAGQPGLAVRRVTVEGVLPSQLDQISLNVTGGLSGSNSAGRTASAFAQPGGAQALLTPSDMVLWKPKVEYGYVLPLVTGRFYGLHFNSLIDWRRLVLRYGEPDLINASLSLFPPAGAPPPAAQFGGAAPPDGGAAGEGVGINLDFIDARYSTLVMQANWLPVAPLAAGTPPALGDLMGTSNLPSGPRNDSFTVVLTSRMNSSAAYPRALSYRLPQRLSQENSLTLTAVQCPPWGCPLPSTGALGAAVKWSSAAAWASGVPPAAGADVRINASTYIIMDVNPPPLGVLTIEGRLEFEDSADRVLTAASIVVWGNLSVGKAATASAAAAPFTHRAEIVLTGVRTSPVVIVDSNVFAGNKVLLALGGVELVGQPRAASWVRLAAPAAKGATTLSLATPVGGPAAPAGSFAWAVGESVTITPTEYDGPGQLEDATIAAVSADGLTLTLAAPLAFAHFAGSAWANASAAPGPLRATRLAAAVGLLNRNVVVRGALSGAGDTYGGHIFVSQVTRAVPGASPPARVTYAGQLTAQSVAFSAMGQGDGSNVYGAVDLQFGDFLLAAGATASAAVASNPVTRIAQSVFANCFNYGVTATATRGLTLDGNVLHRTVRNGVDVSASSPGAVITNNLVAGNFRSPDVNAPGSAQWIAPQAGIFLNTAPARLSGNLVAGGYDAAYTLRGVSCALAPDALAAVLGANEAAASLIGVFVLPTRAPDGSGCVAVRGFTVWKSAHIGVLAMDQPGDFQLRDSLVADSHIGVSINLVATTGGLPAGARGIGSVSVVDSAVIGASPASSCTASNVCRAMTASDVTGASARCGSVFGDGVRRVGVLVPQYTNRGKTCEADGTLATCRPVNRPERLCGMPWERRFGLPSLQAAQFFLTRVAFAGFAGDGDCGGAQASAAIAWNPTQVDMAVPIVATGLSWLGVAPAARFMFAPSALTDARCAAGKGCDGQNLFLLNDVDGSTTGTPASTVLGPNPALASPSPACAPWPATGGLGAFFCAGLTFRAASLLNMDGDVGMRRLGSLEVTRQIGVAPGGASLNRSSMSMGLVDDGCPMRFYFGQIQFAVLPGAQPHRLYLPSTEPAQTRLVLISSDPAEKLVVRMFLTRPNSQNLFLDGALVESKGAAAQAAGMPAASVAAPALADAVGTNLFDPQARHITIVLGGGRATFDIVRVPSIQVTLTLSMTSGQFFDPRTVVTNLALLLGIDASRVRVVSVHADTGGLGRRRRLRPAALEGAGGGSGSGEEEEEGGDAGEEDAEEGAWSRARRLQAGNVTAGAVAGGALAVAVEIVDIVPAVLVTEAPLDNVTSTSGNASLAQQLRMVALASSLSSLAASGQVSAATIGYPVAAIAVTPPSVSAATGAAAAAAASGDGTAPTTPIVLIAPKQGSGAAAGLSGGAIAGIVCGAILGSALVAGALLLVLRQRNAPVAAAAAAAAFEARRAMDKVRAGGGGSGSSDVVGGVNPGFAHALPTTTVVLPPLPLRSLPPASDEGAVSPAGKRSSAFADRPLSFRVVAQPEMVASKASARARAGAGQPTTTAAAAAAHGEPHRAAWR